MGPRVLINGIWYKPAAAATGKTQQHHIFQQSRSILGGDFLGAELTTDREHLGQPFGCPCLPLCWTCRHNSDKRRDHAGIDWIVLGQHSARPGELSKFERTDLAQGDAGCEQGTDDTTFVATARLDANCRNRGAELFNQLGPAVASLLTEDLRSSGKIMTSKRSFDTSMPPNESIAIFVSLSC